MNHETEDQTRLRRAKEALSACGEMENEARKALAAAAESTKRAKERYEELFIAVDKREAAKPRDQYRHCTK